MALSSTFKSGPISRSIGQPAALGTLDHLGGAFLIRHAKADPVVMPEVKFSQITVKVLFLAVLVGAAHSALAALFQPYCEDVGRRASIASFCAFSNRLPGVRARAPDVVPCRGFA